MVFDWGNKIEKFKGQNYKSLKKKFVNSKVLFEDPIFQPNDNSLNLTKTYNVVWKRPKEICDSPRLFVDKANSKDVTQGKLGNCWLVAACSALATVKPLWSQVVPDYKDQEWDPTEPDKYAGIFHFRFFRFGKWVDVVVDDLLPTVDGELIFCHSTTANEFWSALLEKAYAKLCGSYGSLHGGNLCTALNDFTSGLTEIIDLKEGYDEETKKEHLRKILLQEHMDHSLMCCAISTADSALFETRTRSGLVMGHAYGITSVKEINVGSAGLLSFFKSVEKITLVRLRNPWGEREWSGPFSDGSPEWSKISKSEKEKLGLTFEDDGEFWMPFDDFVTGFTDLSICHLINTSIFTFRKSWYEHCIMGEWTLPNNAGGCANNETFLQNPQYRFDVPKYDMEIIIQLLQPDLRSNFTGENKVEYKSIGFTILKVEENRKHIVHKMKPKMATSDYVRNREIYFQGSLNKGRHVIVPTTFDPNVENEFLLRIYTEDKIEIKKITKDYPVSSIVQRCFCIPSPTCTTTISIEKAIGLAKPDNTYCVIKSEHDSLKSQVVNQSQNPQFELNGIFFRLDVCQPMFVELWGKRFFRDKFLGCAVVSGSADNQRLSIKSPLVGRGRKEGERHPGEIQLTYATYDDFNKV